MVFNAMQYNTILHMQVYRIHFTRFHVPNSGIDCLIYQLILRIVSYRRPNWFTNGPMELCNACHSGAIDRTNKRPWSCKQQQCNIWAQLKMSEPKIEFCTQQQKCWYLKKSKYNLWKGVFDCPLFFNCTLMPIIYGSNSTLPCQKLSW